MRTDRSCLAVALSLACALPATAQLVPSPHELKITEVNTGGQHLPAGAIVRDGFVLAWEDEAGGITARRFDDAGTPRGGSFVLAANDALPALPFTNRVLREMHEPSIAARADGSFLAVWTDQKVNRSVDIFIENKWVISSQVVARLFGADGRATSRAWTLSEDASVAARPRAVVSGNSFLVSWQERGGAAPGVHLARIDRSGPAPDSLVAARGERPSLTAGGDGALVTWEKCCGPGGGANQVFARLYNGNGVASGEAFRVAGDQPVAARGPVAAGQPGGGFLVAYQRPIVGDLRNTRVYGQLVSRRGELVGGEVQLSSGYGEAHNAPVVAPLANGGWVVGWMTWQRGFRVATSAGTFTPAGNATGNAFDFNLGTIVGREYTIVTSDDGRVLAVWEGYDEAGKRGLRGRTGRGPTR